MPPKQSSTAVKRGAPASSSSSRPKPKLTQNKLNFASSSSRPFGSRPLTLTPSFSLPDSETPLRPPPEAEVPRLPGTAKRSTSEIAETSPSVASLWSEQWTPTTADELAVHPRKIQDVRKWLLEALEGDASQSRTRKILTLTGPAGSGKSAVVRALSSTSELDFQLLEWTNDAASFDASSYESGSSFIERFTDFLQRGSKFSSLNLQSDQHSAEFAPLSSKGSVANRRIILVEDLPNIHHLPTRQLFQAALEHFIDQSTALSSRGAPNVPIVLIVTECTPRDDQDRWMGDSSSSAWRDRLASVMDTRTALGERIRLHPAHTEIRFNPVAPTILVNGLKRALERQTSKANKLKKDSLPSDVLQAIAQDASGDIRAAVNCLHFACGNSELSLTKRQKALTVTERKKVLRALMPLISGRSSSLALFHAIGRVLYNKRVGDPGGEEDDSKDKRLAERQSLAEGSDDECSHHDALALKQRLASAMKGMGLSSQDDTSMTYSLPSSLSHLKRRTSRVDIDQLWGDLPVDAVMFQLYLHQNYPQFTAELDECETIIDSISTADSLSLSQDQYRHSSLLSYYNFFITVQGTLMGLPSPVPRKGQKLGKATYWDVQKKLRQRLDSISELKSWLGYGSERFSSISAGSHSEDGSWAESRFKRYKFSNQTHLSDQIRSDDDRSDAGLGDTSRSWLMKCDALSLTTEVLPLLSKIQPEGYPQELSQLARMRFEYAGVSDLALRALGEHDLSLDQDDDSEPTQKANRKSPGEQAISMTKPLAGEIKMYLSEDDIDDF